VNAAELGKLTREQLSAAGLWDLVDQHKSQFLEFPDGFFAEIVLKDGSKIAEAELVESDLRQSLRKQGTELDVIVRSIWAVDSVGDPKVVPGTPGVSDFSVVYPARLVSGGLTVDVQVEVTILASEAIKRRAKQSAGSYDRKAATKQVVKEFLDLQLSFGGESYWDPIRHPKQELNDSALLYLFTHGPVAKH
jgi:hypothetical protein